MPTTVSVVAVGSVLPMFDLMAVVLRFIAKRGRPRGGIGARYRVDDYLILFSLIVSLSLGAIMIFGAVKFGYGKNSAGVMSKMDIVAGKEITMNTQKLTIVFNELQIWTLGATKLSVLYFYRAIFVGTVFNILSWAMICVVTAVMPITFFLVLFQCGVHINWLWSSPAVFAGHCLSGTKLASAFCIVDVITDTFIILMPWYWIMNLHMPRLKRLVIFGIFLFGALAVVASAARLIVYLRVYPSHYSNPNLLGFNTDIVYYSMLEVGLTIIAACLPTFGPLFSDSFKRRLTLTLRRFSTSFPRFRYRFSSIDRPAMVSQSETRIVWDGPHMGLETVAFVDGNREIDVPLGQIHVTTDTNRSSSSIE
ncbi:hypothetical protein MMC07_008508 [Pseudocyphellaria aurata]|nr:hypothetical protein [Pseudocyphellaria aurata]